MAFYQTFPTNSFVPLFQLMDDYHDVRRSKRSSCSSRQHNQPRAISRPFTPKFDVRETGDSYLLDGELPGVHQENVEIEFTDPQTLVIKGRVEHEYDSHNIDDHSASDSMSVDHDDSSSTKSNKSQRPTVEDEDEENSRKDSSAVPATSLKSPSTQHSQTSKTNTEQKPSFKQWLSERSVGEFHRTFNLSSRVNQDAVRANLSNGILSLVLPKEPAHTVKKIRIE
jgi:HSP20 family molecular chaperone IbpA